MEAAYQKRTWRVSQVVKEENNINWIGKGGNVLFHFSSRPNQGPGQIVMNSKVDGSWGKEEVLDYDTQREINLEVTATKKGFLVQFNGEFFHFFKARVPWETFSCIELRDKNGKTDKPIWKIEEVDAKPNLLEGETFQPQNSENNGGKIPYLALKDLEYLQLIVNNSVNQVRELIKNKILDEKTAVANEFQVIQDRMTQMNEKQNIEGEEEEKQSVAPLKIKQPSCSSTQYQKRRFIKKQIQFINPLNTNGEQINGEYFGETVNGIPQGIGTIKQSFIQNNLTLYGEFNRGRLHGTVLVVQDSKQHVGQFIDGVPQGYGKIYNQSIIQYEGNFKNQKDGQGTMVMANGDVFEGEWENGLKKKGKVTTPDGLVAEETYDVEKDIQEKKTPDQQISI